MKMLKTIVLTTLILINFQICSLTIESEITDPMMCPAQTISINGNIGYIGERGCGIELVDISDPYNLKNLGRFYHPEYSIIETLISGDYLYASGSGSLLIFDISEGMSIISPISILSGFSNSSYNLIVQNNIMYVNVNEQGFAIIDVSDKENPILLSRNTRDEGYLFGEIVKDIAIKEDYVFLAAYDTGLTVVDVSNKYNPVKMYNYTTVPGIVDDLNLNSIEIIDNIAYLAEDRFGLIAVNISDVSDVSLTNTFELETNTRTKNLQVIDDLVYLVTENCLTLEYGFKIIDVSNPSIYLEVSNYTDIGYAVEDLYIDKYNDLIFLAKMKKGITVIDSSDINNLIEIENYEIPDIIPTDYYSSEKTTSYFLISILGIAVIILQRLRRKKKFDYNSNH